MNSLILFFGLNAKTLENQWIPCRFFGGSLFSVGNTLTNVWFPITDDIVPISLEACVANSLKVPKRMDTLKINGWFRCISYGLWKEILHRLISI